MTIAEYERFKNQDDKKYIINENKDFLKWLKEQINKGYKLLIDIDEIQNLIDNIVAWYEIKYPERELVYYEGCTYDTFEYKEKLSKYMNFNQLRFRLKHDQLLLLDCEYKGTMYNKYAIFEDGKNGGYESRITITIRRRDNNCYGYCPVIHIHANPKTGEVEIDKYNKCFANKKSIILDEILDSIKKESPKLDFKELEECVNNHNIGLELRKKVLQLVALKLLYSNNTTAERGYERAIRFIGEFNKHIPSLNLTTKEIDEIMQRNYKQPNEILYIEQEEPVKVHKLNLKSVERFIKDFARVK